MENYIPFKGSLRSRHAKRKGYNRVSPNRKSVKVARFGSNRSWKLKLAPKLRLASPLKLWHKLKNAYVNSMLRLANSSATFNSGKVFGDKRIPQARDVRTDYSRTEFENRLIFEIYKSMVASYELGYTPNNPTSTTSDQMRNSPPPPPPPQPFRPPPPPMFSPPPPPPPTHNFGLPLQSPNYFYDPPSPPPPPPPTPVPLPPGPPPYTLLPAHPGPPPLVYTINRPGPPPPPYEDYPPPQPPTSWFRPPPPY